MSCRSVLGLAFAASALGLPGNRRVTFDLHQAPRRRAARAADRREPLVAQEQPRDTLESDSPHPRLRRLQAPSHPVDLFNLDNVQYVMRVEIGEPCHGPGRDGEEAASGPPRALPAKRTSDLVPVESQYGGQVLEVLPDTGSPDLWVAASNCTNCLENATLFDVSASCTAQQLGDRERFAYRDGTSASGGSFLDTVRFGDLKLTSQFLIQVDHMDAETSMQSDGILGLAPFSSRGKTFLTRMFEEREHSVLPKQFSFFLKGHTDSTSKLVFGDPDFDQYSKETKFQYAKAHGGQSQATWLVSVRSVTWTGSSWSGRSLAAQGAAPLGRGIGALVDSGTSLMVLPSELYDSLMAELLWRLSGCVHDAKQDVVRCDCPPANDLSRMPWLVITFIGDDDEDFSVCMASEEFILESPDPERPGGAQCIPAFSRGGVTETQRMILGMTFMRSFYTNFDIDSMRVGFARSAESPLPGLSMCNPHRKSIWCASVAVMLASVAFVCYVALDYDMGKKEAGADCSAEGGGEVEAASSPASK